MKLFSFASSRLDFYSTKGKAGNSVRDYEENQTAILWHNNRLGVISMLTKLSKTSLATRIACGFAIILVGCIAYSVVDMHIRTIRHMRQTSVFLNSKPSEPELLARFGTPRLIYQSWTDVPAKFQRGFPQDVTTNSIFYLYTKEGM